MKERLGIASEVRSMYRGRRGTGWSKEDSTKPRSGLSGDNALL